MAASHYEDPTYPPSKKRDENVAIVNDVSSISLRQALEHCLDVLKIKDKSEIYRNIKVIQKKGSVNAQYEKSKNGFSSYVRCNNKFKIKVQK